MEHAIIQKETASLYHGDTLVQGERLEGLFTLLGGEELVTNFFELKEDSQYALLFSNTAYDDLAKASPCLFETFPGTSLFSYFRDLQTDWGLWAMSMADIKVTSAHWQSLLNVLMPDGTISHFRFYSSAVFRTLANACTPSELAMLMGPYHTIHTVLENGDLFEFRHPSLEYASPAQIAEEYTLSTGVWWQVTDIQLEAFKPILDKVFRSNIELWLWENYFAEADVAGDIWGSLENFIEWAIEDGRREGLKSSDELSRYIAAIVPFVCSTEKPPFVKSPVLRGVNPEDRLVELEAAAHKVRS